ncbi:MAG TPA: hypothetical protein VKR81_04655, partial [Candidatus Binatia bacterium]|nr:hypothetical protein [Candidatus Binatia bacterium]
FGIKGGEFLFFVEKLNRTVQPNMGVDSLIGVGARVRFLGNLKDDPIRGDSSVADLKTFEYRSFFENLFSRRAALGPGISARCLRIKS